ncbi:hypothetical protein [Chryseobacterium jejuense]|uniref:Glycosyltransferase RgtA/B/C/D-like domain-containing protein n=1 Tax=Chryseobacterium jejuense TaxID=445960 RepID=A0A2X2ZBB8_CHRJE|nr:hypothetical protein [Chryseobacterium jejuense]SDI54649.1 hypothetical protein SAMN05421542_1252 [Chryseobacterium jejuense]SQB46989.1 Uncharacterised protein [Chryseobacterium jejuense]
MGIIRNIGLRSFLLSFTLFFSVCLLYYINSVLKTDGHYIYLLDDAYIHLAMAKNFALYEVWGMTRYQFSSTSSSPLFTYILSVLIKVFGNNDQIPLYFNVIFSIATLYVLSEYYAEVFKEVKKTVLAVLFTTFFIVLPLNILSGMEHVFQIFLFVVNILCLSHYKDRKLAVFGFYFSLLLMGLVRFESMFYFVILAFMFVLVRKWKEALFILLLGFIPIIAFCAYNYQQDGYFFPNSVVVKGTKLSLDANVLGQLKVILLDNLLLNISFYKIGFFPLLLCVIFIYRDVRMKTFREVLKDNFLLIVFSLVMICHAMFADLKGLLRYEAYILTGFCMVLILKCKDLFFNFTNYIRKEKLVSLLIAANVFLMLYKCCVAHPIMSNGGKNIYEQQVQSAKFLHQFYNTSKVVANDIGAISYFTNIHLLDIAGLASVETIHFNENKKGFDQKFGNFLSKYCLDHQYDIAVVYEGWLQGYVPSYWKKAGTLKIEDKITVARLEVSIYSIDTKNLEELKQNIKKFDWNKNVTVTIIE